MANVMTPEERAAFFVDRPDVRDYTRLPFVLRAELVFDGGDVWLYVDADVAEAEQYWINTEDVYPSAVRDYKRGRRQGLDIDEAWDILHAAIDITDNNDVPRAVRAAVGS